MSAMIEATPLIRPAITPLPKGDSCVLVIFGASGDLTQRKLIPALYDLACIGCTHPQFQVLGIGRTKMTSEQFRTHMHDAAASSKEARSYSEEKWAEFQKRMFYFVGDANDPNFYPLLRARLEEMRNSGSSANHLF